MTAVAQSVVRDEATIRETIHELILELAPKPPEGGLEPQHRLVADLAFHSLALMELAFTLEDEFGLDQMNEEQALKIERACDVEEHVLAELRRKGKLG